MELDDIRDYCLSKPASEETLPFGPDVLVFKVLGKVFLLLPLDSEELQFNAKVDPEEAEEQRERYACVQPGFHMNKKHWNTITVDGSVSTSQLKKWIDDSYDLVVKSLPVKKREELQGAKPKKAVKKSPAKKRKK